MKNLKYNLLKNKMKIIIISIILICAIAIAIGVYAQVTNRNVMEKSDEKSETINYENLESNFNGIFTDTINVEEKANQDINYDEIIYLAYDIKPEEDKNYSIDAKIPLFKIQNDVTKQINNEILGTFATTIRNIVYNSTSHTVFDLDYVAYVNGDILSLVIRCKYKDGTSPQRDLIQTYNYYLINNKLVTLNEIIELKNLDTEVVENKILEKIKYSNEQIKNLSDQGYNIYIRNEEDEMYKIENTQNFFLGQDNILYIVYAYGNNNYSSEIDLVIF